MNLPEPQVPCAVCMKKYVKSKTTIFVYCTCRNVGSSMQIINGIPTGTWFTFSPVTKDQAEFLNRSTGAAVK